MNGFGYPARLMMGIVIKKNSFALIVKQRNFLDF